MTEQGHKKEMRTQLRRVRPAQLQLITNKDMTSKGGFTISCVVTGSQCKRTGKRKNRTWLYSCVCRTFTLTSGRNARYCKAALRPQKGWKEH